MIAIRLRFPGHRYHATPWDAHVNEGRVEWPPSPWRILRALVATWYWKCPDEIAPPVLARLLERLGSEPPHYRGLQVPLGQGHTRHYMPLFQEKTTLVFDAFLDVRGGRLSVEWPNVTLAEDERRALELLATRLGYLGRAESWIEASVADAPLAGPLLAKPLEAASAQVAGAINGACEGSLAGALADLDQTSTCTEAEPLRLLGPLSPDALDRWRSHELELRLEQALTDKQDKARTKAGSISKAAAKDPSRVALTKRERDAVGVGLPANMLEALQADTAVLRRAGWSRPPGSEWFRYVSTAETAPRANRSRAPLRRMQALPTAARFALSGAVLPRMTDALLVAERVHRALVKRSHGAEVFRGRDAERRPLAGHQHAYVLPESNDRAGYVTHITVYAPGGFDGKARRALAGLEQLVARDAERGDAPLGKWSRHELRLTLLGMGLPETFDASSEPERSDGRKGACPTLAKAHEWVSRTPFVSTRYPKRTRAGQAKLDPRGIQVGSPEHDLRRLLTIAGLPEPIAVQPLEAAWLGDKRTGWLSFRTSRTSGGGARGPSSGTGFRLAFATAVQGPLALGFGAHFGLGVFVPERSRPLAVRTRGASG